MDRLPPWSVNTLAQEAARVALFDEDFFVNVSLTLITQERKRLRRQLRCLPGLRVYPSSANFFIIEFYVSRETQKFRNRIFVKKES